MPDATYRAYVQRQVTKSQRYRTHVAGRRVRDLVRWWLGLLPVGWPTGRSVLAVGCRNTHELMVLRLAGFATVVGIDLWSEEPAILAMDMHHLTFADRSMDAVFASHSLEHSYDPDRAMREWTRVTKPGGVWVIEVPIGYAPTAIDRQNFRSARMLLRRCQASDPRVQPIAIEESPDLTVARVVVRL